MPVNNSHLPSFWHSTLYDRAQGLTEGGIVFGGRVYLLTFHSNIGFSANDVHILLQTLFFKKTRARTLVSTAQKFLLPFRLIGKFNQIIKPRAG